MAIVVGWRPWWSLAGTVKWCSRLLIKWILLSPPPLSPPLTECWYPQLNPAVVLRAQHLAVVAQQLRVGGLVGAVDHQPGWSAQHNTAQHSAAQHSPAQHGGGVNRDVWNKWDSVASSVLLVRLQLTARAPVCMHCALPHGMVARAVCACVL